MSHIVKRAGHKEAYDSKKVYASVYSALLSVRVPKGEAELVAEKVTKDVNAAITGKKEVTSHEIYLHISESLSLLNPDAGYMYKTHRDIN